MTKYLYIVDYWVPFPTSEYGGLQIIIADSDEECIDLIKKSTYSYEKKYPWKKLIQQAVTNSRRYPLLGEPASGIVDEMVT